jgi:DMSO reductase anchor subunit
MHPAYSVIVFTTLSGAGYGLLAWLALGAAFGPLAQDGLLGLVGLAIAFVLIAIGLLSSTAHLGRPERAWRAFSQWRSSWLSREAVLAVATFVPSGLLALLWVFMGGGPGWARTPLAVLTVAGALSTVWCTGMIYQSLPTIRAWHRPLVSPIYVVLGMASGGVLLQALLTVLGYESETVLWGTVVALAAGAVMKVLYWRSIDADGKTWTAGDATGLGRFGKVRVLEQPHTQENFVMREMGYAVGRRHSERLRKIGLLLGFAVPSIALLLAAGAPMVLAIFCAVIAVAACLVGMFVERWLFFAEAQHVVTVFYGAEAA